MKRLLPYPLLALVLMLTWLLLNDSADAAQLVLALPIGLAGAVAYALLERPRGNVRRLVPAVGLLRVVLLDIVRSNLAVARIVLLPRRPRVSGFVSIPLDLKDPAGLAVLACIVTATPGTSWARHDAAAGVLTLHVLDLVDEAAWSRQIKERYERRLMEIFG
jgi:multicomponent K+:H+ antiporter subunit E